MLVAILLICAPCLGAAPEVEEAHAGNPLYRALLGGETAIDGRTISFPAPALRDGQDAEAQRAALRGVAGSERAAQEFLRDSVSAPLVLKVRDETAEGGDIIRRADLWFALRADLGAIDPDDVLGRARKDGKPIEAGNMRFQARMLGGDDLASRSIEAAGPVKDRAERYAHLTGLLLDRIHVEATDRAFATRSADSWVIASRTDPRFDKDEALPNRWWPIVRRGGRDEPGPARRYAGGAAYVKVSRLREPSGVLLVEAHFAFAEPRAWFDGAPILRSKIGPVAQDQIRRLRRELAKGEKSTDRR